LARELRSSTDPFSDKERASRKQFSASERLPLDANSTPLSKDKTADNLVEISLKYHTIFGMISGDIKLFLQFCFEQRILDSIRQICQLNCKACASPLLGKE